MKAKTKKFIERRIAKATAFRRGIPKCIVDWRLARGWPLCYLHCDTIDDKGMH